MSTYSNGFTVPTLSLTGSRAKKQYSGLVPTRDYSHILSNNPPANQNDANIENKIQPTISSNPYTQPEKYRRPPIFPPKGASTQKADSSQQSNIEYTSKDLNKNVYLERRDEYNGVEYERNTAQRFQQGNPQELRKSSSRRGLLSNPISSRIIEEEVNQRSLSRKADISKVLFDRRLSKLMEQANYYDEEMMAICRDELSPHLAELQKLKEDNVSIHKDILEGLNALIS